MIKPIIISLTLCSFTSLHAQKPTPSAETSENLTLTIDALKTLVKNTPGDAQTHQALIQATQSAEAKTQQQAWPLFEGIQSELTNTHLVNAINNLTEQSQQHPAAIEIIEVAKTFLDPKVKSALQKYLKTHTKSDPLSKWLPSLDGGDAKSGEQIFKTHAAAQCATCHHSDYLTAPTDTSKAGPNLAGIATRLNHLRKDLLEAVILPDATITEGFGIVTVEFEKGALSGNLLSYQPSGIVVQVGDAPRLISYNDYQNLIFAPSTMPSMTDKLSLREARDLVAFLDTLTDETGKPPLGDAIINAKPYDLSELSTENSANEIPLEIKQQRLYAMNCMACHQPNGEGSETFPPLAESIWVSGDKQTLIKMQLLGLSGAIEVNGKVYDGIAMPSNARLSDADIAHILTYIRTTPSWGNNASEITAEEVAEVRKKIGKSTTPLDATKLVHPEKEIEQIEPKTINVDKKTGLWTYLIIPFLILAGIGLYLRTR